MQTVTVKFKENVLKQMDETIANSLFNTRTEFIREAVRDKMKKLSTEELMAEVAKQYGSLKGKAKNPHLSDEDIREMCSKETLKKYNKKFNLNLEV